MTSVPYVDLGICEYMSETPSQRFPIYTRGNAGEVWPDVVYPLSASLTWSTEGNPFAAPMLATGLITESDIAEGPRTMGGVFGGYMYLNVSLNRVVAVRMLGTTVEEVDASYLGSEGLAPPYESRPGDKDLMATIRGLRYGWKAARTVALPHLDDDRRLVESWNRRLPHLLAAPDADLVETIRSLVAPTIEMFGRHVDVTGRAGGSMQALARFCERRLGDRSLALTLLAGLGEVDSAVPSFELWRLSRVVCEDLNLSAQFDLGLDGLSDRLEADPTANNFTEAFADFQERFGSRGPNEWETGAETWGTDPALALALIDRMRLAGEEHDPSTRSAALARQREAAYGEARGRLRWPTRKLFEWMVKSAHLYSPARERSKTIIIDLVHVGRLLTRELGRRCAERSGGDPKDVWFVFDEELEAYVSDPASMESTIATRRAARDELGLREPPFVFVGEMPPPSTWPLRSDASDHDVVTVGEVLDGLGGCAGVTVGRARVVADPSEPGELGPGDVLVAPLTDPAWTPLFVPVEAVVVDVGGQMSHAVIVSRELGRPCVVAVTGATQRIPDGATVRVDGTAGTVTVLGLP